MKILFVVPYVPSLIRVRPFNLIKNLAARGHQVTVMTLYSNPEELGALADLNTAVDDIEAMNIPRWRSFYNCLLALPRSVPLQAVYSWDQGFANRMAELIYNAAPRERFDLVHVEHLRGVNYGLHLQDLNGKRAQSPPVPIVWDSVDCISYLFEQSSQTSTNPFSRWLTRFELRRTRPYEAALIDKFSRVLVTSKMDREAFYSLAPENPGREGISVLPNGVDLDYFVPPHGGGRASDSLVISGKMSYHANVTMTLHFTEEIFPLIQASRPGVKLSIVGKDPPGEIQRLAENPSITVTGTVPSILPYLQNASVAVAPITYGAGIQNKILEAMACGTPVVTYPRAIASLAARPDRDIIAAENPQAFAEQVILLLQDADRNSAMGQAGRQYVEEHHNWETITASLEEMYQDVISEAKPEIHGGVDNG